MFADRTLSLIDMTRLLEEELQQSPGQVLLRTQSLAWLSDVTLLAQRATGMPIAFVSVLDRSKTYFVAQQGADLPPAPRVSTLCDLVARSGQPVVIPDAAAEPVLADYPAVREGLRSYVGVPIGHGAEPVAFSLCVADGLPHADAAAAVEVLEALARVAARTLET